MLVFPSLSFKDKGQESAFDLHTVMRVPCPQLPVMRSHPPQEEMRPGRCPGALSRRVDVSEELTSESSTQQSLLNYGWQQPESPRLEEVIKSLKTV